MRSILTMLAMDEFYSTFDIKEGDKMYRPDSWVKIW